MLSFTRVLQVPGSATLTLLLAGYFAQQFLPPPAPKVVGIDLGTTYSCVGVYHAVSGQVQIIKDPDGKLCIPSIVAFSGDDVVVGYKAGALSDHSPHHTLYDAKRFLGKKFSRSELVSEAGRYPFKLVADEYGMVHYVLSDGKNVTKVAPEQVGAHIISTLKATAQRNLSTSVTRAVMSVPAEFDAMQRNFTQRAAKIAGLDVLRIISEPTAAALAYGLHKKASAEIVVVVDLGGGTLDVSLLRVQGGMFLTQAIAGNNHLGGQDFNERLLNHFLTLIQRKFGERISNTRDLHRLRMAAETAKLQLTAQHAADVAVRLDSISVNGSKGTFNHKLTRNEFEEVNSDLLKKVVDPISVVLRETEMTPADVDEVVLVGGSTRIPRVRMLISEFFGKPPNVAIEPELAVVMGVAIQAGILSGAWPLSVSATEIPHRLRKIHVQ